MSEGIDKGELRKVCAQADCPIHHPKKQSTKADSSFKAEQEKRRREEALANATGMRVLQTIVDVVREYPENFAGRRTWADRMFYRDPQTQIAVPLANLWNDGGPSIVKQFIAAMRLLEWTPVRSALRLALTDRAAVWPDREAAV